MFGPASKKAAEIRRTPKAKRNHWRKQKHDRAVLAVRSDDKDLAIDDVRMMCCFARRKLQPMFEDALGGGYVQRTKKEVLDFITWGNRRRPGRTKTRGGRRATGAAIYFEFLGSKVVSVLDHWMFFYNIAVADQC